VLRPPVRELPLKTVSVKALPVKAPPVKALPAKAGKAPKAAKAACTSNVVLNAGVEPIIHKDEDLVLLHKPLEEELLISSMAGSHSKNRSRKNESDRRTQEERDTAAAIAVSLSAKPPLRSPPPAPQTRSAKDSHAFPGLPTPGPQPLSAAAKAGMRDRKAGRLH